MPQTSSSPQLQQRPYMLNDNQRTHQRNSQSHPTSPNTNDGTTYRSPPTLPEAQRVSQQKINQDGNVQSQKQRLQRPGQSSSQKQIQQRPARPQLPAKLQRPRYVGLVQDTQIEESTEVIKVRFSIQIKVEYGQRLRLVGSSPELGEWQLKKGIDMKWSEGDIWRMEVRLPSNIVIGYKYVVVGQDGNACSWQNGNNSVLVVDAKAGQVLQVADNWGAQPGATVRVGQQATTRENALTNWSKQMSTKVQTQRQELRQQRMELFQARQELQEATQESARLRAELAAIQKERLQAQRIQRLQKENEERAIAENIKTKLEMQQMLEHASDILASTDEA
eukprot:TRINITY_DN2967_c0_g2_i3.p1 TRINITY_DN2967_c0_g2~~TRINITY_DN2967_c0_g2_i3.p1  ORF type:complete len:335 (-),score=33.12 TRINITY_DN2967_c0_g2_i3:1982-2986(-)